MAKNIVKEIRSATRRKFSAEEKIRMVLVVRVTHRRVPSKVLEHCQIGNGSDALYHCCGNWGRLGHVLVSR